MTKLTKQIIKLHLVLYLGAHRQLQKNLTAFDTDADKVENQNGKTEVEVFTRPSSYILKYQD